MKGGGKIYPNKGVKIDPRAITSARMPESLKIYSGYLIRGYTYLKSEGIMTRKYIEKEEAKIKALRPFTLTNNKFESSHWFLSETHLVEFFRTSEYNYKVYALKFIHLEESKSPFRNSGMYQ